MTLRAIWLILITLTFLFLPSRVFANHLILSEADIKDVSAASKTVTVTFKVCWENSWRDAVNYDAVWVFLKYSTDSGTTWNPATMALSGKNPSGFSTGSGTPVEIIVPADMKGCFIQRAQSSVGNTQVSDAEILWDYGSDGLTDTQAFSQVSLKIFGIEMVYIPQGSFFAGDNGASTASLKRGYSDANPWLITSESEIPVTNAARDGYFYTSGGNVNEDPTGNNFVIPYNFPKGYNGFYLMKYEITEGQWVDFFNALTPAQKAARNITNGSGKNSQGTVDRNTISWPGGSQDAVTLRPDRGCGFLSWMDGCAYADWAALRPMTELEYEKACRGTNVAPTGGEYAWGNLSAVAITNVSGIEDGTETSGTPSAVSNFGNSNFNGGDDSQGPVRAGIFATSVSTRTSSGGGYYGNMELSGNLAEHCVTIGNDSGRLFSGTEGDGFLSANGNATNADWPGFNGGEVTSALGSGLRGGSWFEGAPRMRVSDRSLAALNDASRLSRYGFRAARSERGE